MFSMKYIPVIALAMVAVPASAKEIVVQMKTKGADGMMVFEPAVVHARVGDQVRFVPTDPSHNAETIPGIWPAGQTPIKGALNKEVTLKVATPGIYGIKCAPHFAMGMVALVVAGNANLKAARAAVLPPFAAKRLRPELDSVR